MTVPNATRAFAPGAFLITPGDRSDILLAASLAVLGGTPLAGVLLTGGLKPYSMALRTRKSTSDGSTRDRSVCS